MKNKKLIAVVIILILIGGAFKIYNVLNVSENVKAMTLLKSIFELEKNNALIYEVSKTPLAFIVNKDDNFMSCMEKSKFKLIDQVGSIYIFKKNDEKKVFKSYKITQNYTFFEELKVDK